MPKRITNMGASVRQRLLNYSRDNDVDHQRVLAHYAMERLLYRVSVSQYAYLFVLKGAMLSLTWMPAKSRYTRDLDFFGRMEPDPLLLTEMFKDILAQEHPDGIVFDVNAVDMKPIRSSSKFDGYRSRMRACIGGVEVLFHVDIGLGDAAETPPEHLVYHPTLLDMPAPSIYGDVRESVIAEKFFAMVLYGERNSRMKDYFDIWMIHKAGGVDIDRLAFAISTTFAKQETLIPSDTPIALSQEFAIDPIVGERWKVFLKSVTFDPAPFPVIIQEVKSFLMPVAAMARKLSNKIDIE